MNKHLLYKNGLFCTSFIIVFIVLLTGCTKEPNNRTFENPDQPGGMGHCEFTDATEESPNYLTNAPELININVQNANGENMRIQGIVFDNNDRPLPNAKVEIWHADTDGVYHPEGEGDIADYDARDINLRGTGFTDAEGEFNFVSIQPGLYKERRRHIYYRIEAPGYKSIVTQTYWLSEKGNLRDLLDDVDENPEDCRYLDFQPDSGSGGIIGVFNIYLEKE